MRRRGRRIRKGAGRVRRKWSTNDKWIVDTVFGATARVSHPISN